MVADGDREETDEIGDLMNVGEREMQRAEDAVEAFDPATSQREWIFKWPDAGGQFHEHRFIQAKLGLFPAQELGTMLTRLSRDVMSGKYGVDVAALLRDRKSLSAAKATVEHEHDGIKHEHVLNIDGLIDDQIFDLAADHRLGDEKMTIEEFVEGFEAAHEHVSLDVEGVYNQWRPYIDAFLALVDEVPGLQQDIIALSLGVRRRDRAEFKERIAEAPHNGGLEIDDGVEIIKNFVQQNAESIRRFLGDQLREIGEVVMGAIEGLGQGESSNGSTPSSTSSAPTQG